MLSPNEFTVGTFGSAEPLSLILPRTEYEATVLIGHVDNAPAAVFLAGQYAFEFFMTEGSDNWNGLIVPDVRVEVDEGSIFDPDQGRVPLRSVIRTDTRLIIRAKRERSSTSLTAVTLHDQLESAGEYQAGFKRWQVVIGEGPTKRVLWKEPSGNELPQGQGPR